MKKIRLFSLMAAFMLTACCFSFEASADNVSRERAAAAAEKFFSHSKLTASRASRVQLACTGVPGAQMTKSAEAPTMYIFNLPGGGFVIISGDDAATPVMAYSFTGSFVTENMPDNVIWWLDAMDRRVREIRNDRTLAEKGAGQKWAELETETKAPGKSDYEPVVILETAKWDQDDPYNRQCYTKTGVKAVTGCGPTSMSIIMNYLRLPEGDFLTTAGDKDDAFAWDLMLPEYKQGSFSSAQADAVARLMAENGKRAQAMYGAEETSTFSVDVRDAYLSYKNADGSSVFDGALELENREFYSADQWSELLKRELNDSIPIGYSGQSNSGGHAFTVDGYDTGGNFHINYGWGGNNDGYYNLYNITYRSDQDALIGLKRDQGGKDGLKVVFTLWRNSVGAEGLVASSHKFEVDVPFTVNFGFVTNYSNSLYFTGAIKFVHIDKDGNQIEDVADIYEIISLAPGHGEYDTDWPCVIHEKINIGDKIVIFYRVGNDGEWLRLPFNTENGMPAELIIADTQTISESTSIDYVIIDGAIVFTVKSGVEAVLQGPDGSPVTLARDEQKSNWIYTTKITRSGNYKLILDKEEDHVELNLIF